MTILIRRIIINNETWFELLGHKLEEQIFVDYPCIETLQNNGYVIKDLDAIKREMEIRN